MDDWRGRRDRHRCRAQLAPARRAGRLACTAGHADGGFEHPKRRHALYVATAQGPHLAWQYDEPQGNYQSWVLAPTGRIPVLLVRYASPQDDAPDQIETRSLRWNKGRQAFAEQASAPPAAVQAVVASRYASVAAARAARAQQAECLGAYSVVRTRPAGAAPHHALVQVAADMAQAHAESLRLRACSASLQPRTVPLVHLLPDAGLNPGKKPATNPTANPSPPAEPVLRAISTTTKRGETCLTSRTA